MLTEGAKIYVKTLGCKVNQTETLDITSVLEDCGYKISNKPEGALYAIINTCCVTTTAEAKCRKAIRKALRTPSIETVFVTGCYAVMNAAEIEAISERVSIEENWQNVAYSLMQIDDAGYEFDADGKIIPESLTVGTCYGMGSDPVRTVATYHTHSRVNIKVSDGCENFCSFCIVPYARGGVEPNGSTEIIARVKALVDGGVKEVVLTGINIGTYDCDGLNLGQLIVKLRKDTGIHRVRVSSIEPQTFHREFVDLLRETDILCEQLHIPLQSGSDEVLAHMNRRYNVAQYRAGIGVLRRIKPHIAIHTDIIVGYPTETDADFEATLALARELQFAGAHLFKFSGRTGTPAAELAPLDPYVIEQRFARLREVTDASAAAYRKMRLAAQEESPLELIVEKVGESSFTATSREHLTIEYNFDTLQSEDLSKIVPGALFSQRLDEFSW